MAAGTLLVTGASGVIGRAVVKALAADSQWDDCRFLLTGRDTRRLEETAGLAGRDRSKTLVLDLAAGEAAAHLAGSLEGPLAGAVLVAGQGGDSPLARTPFSSWDELWQANLAGHARLLRCLEGTGSTPVVLVGSIVGLRGNEGQSVYASCKGALLDLVSFYRWIAPTRGIRLNCLLPPLVDSPLLSRLGKDARQRLFSSRLLDDPSAAATAAAQAVFLMSSRSSYVNGTVWHGDSRVSRLPWQ